MVIYLDCAATTPVDPEVLEVVNHYMVEEYGNAGSRHVFGLAGKKGVERAREQIAAAVACDPTEVIFTSGATESNNLAILGLADEGERTGRKHIVSTHIEHKSVLEPLSYLARRRGFELSLVLPSRDGRVEPGRIVESLRPDTLLVSVMSVNNETGMIQPIRECATALASHDAYFHVDAAQAFGKSTDLQHPRIDLLAISGHKVFAPKGIGCLIARRRGWVVPPLSPLMWGGGQEGGIRPGTLPVPLAAGLGKAAHLCMTQWEERSQAVRRNESVILEAFLKAGATVVGAKANRVAGIAAIMLPGVDGDAALLALRPYMAASTGATCSSSRHLPSHVFMSMGYNEDEAGRIMRVSWCHATERSALDGVAHSISRLIPQMSGMPPAGPASVG